MGFDSSVGGGFVSTMDASERQRLRESLRAQRRGMEARARLQAAAAVARQVQPLLGSRRVAGYWACDGEMPLHAVLPLVAPQRYALPVIEPGRRMHFAPWQAGDALRTNRYGIPEPATTERWLPAELHVVLMPLLAFNRTGDRLGMGGGYYDRAFAFLLEPPRQPEPLLVGVAYAFQEVAAFTPEPWDVPLDWIVTERELIDTRGARAAPTSKD